MGRIEGAADDGRPAGAQRSWQRGAECWFIGSLVIVVATGAVFAASGMETTGGVEPPPASERTSQPGDASGPSERTLEQLAIENRAAGAAAVHVFLVAADDVQALEAMLDSEAVVRDLAGEPPRKQVILVQGSAVGRWMERRGAIHRRRGCARGGGAGRRVAMKLTALTSPLYGEREKCGWAEVALAECVELKLVNGG